MSRLQAEQQRLYEPGPRALVLSATTGWDRLGALWQGVQAGLALPAPAIAVSGSAGYQLWFSTAEPLAQARALEFLDALRQRYLADVPRDRVSMTIGPPLPPFEAAPDQWSAFVASDLAALFSDEPWLDIPPGAEAQAELLSRLKSMKTEDVERVLAAPAAPAANTQAPQQDPRSFLLAVMNDPAVAMHLRIEAAKALLAQQRQ
ncbi:hypothetical protein HHL11_10410 [Ramlibacter sp. G-1-2-2]|uniref:Uncharacterized protein n=1 Tax=Ramlibacter agri TaxID=2728837 RepID=A0A848H6H0_9BURK|nr:hypothetical protein [Ramlibacter agri]NML44163.1 hypothetical protein [Ramlibacter agri]